MNLLRIALLLAGISLLATLHAQKPPMKWGKLELEELNMAAYPEDTTAAAVVLGDYATLKFDFGQGSRYVFEHHRRIKILDKSAFNRGNIQIYLYGDDQISGLKAQTISRGSGQTFRLKSRDFYEEEFTEGEEALVKKLQKYFPESQVEGIQVALPDNPVDAVKSGYTAQVPGAAQAFNDFIYFSPCILPYFEENPFQKAERSYPVDLAHPFDVRDIFIINIPEGYTLEDMPEAANFALPGKAGSFEFIPSESGGKVNLVYGLKLNKIHFEPQEYASLKQFLDLVIEKQGEQFVFRKKT